MNQCRICYEESGEMISPCLCKGTIKNVHEECLYTSLLFANNYNKCSICNYEYMLEELKPDKFISFYILLDKHCNKISMILVLGLYWLFEILYFYSIKKSISKLSISIQNDYYTHQYVIFYLVIFNSVFIRLSDIIYSRINPFFHNFLIKIIIRVFIFLVIGFSLFYCLSMAEHMIEKEVLKENAYSAMTMYIILIIISHIFCGTKYYCWYLDIFNNFILNPINVNNFLFSIILESVKEKITFLTRRRIRKLKIKNI